MRKPPCAFSEHGVVMAANILRSERAIEASSAHACSRCLAQAHNRVQQLIHNPASSLGSCLFRDFCGKIH